MRKHAAGLIVQMISLLFWMGAIAAQDGEKAAFESPGASLRGSLHYYLSRMNPDGFEERVTLPAEFKSRSVAYLNIEPGMDGSLLVYAGDQGKTPGQFFPLPPYKGSERVRRGEKIRLPIRFDNNPSTTEFTVVLIDNESEDNQILAELAQNKLIGFDSIKGFLKSNAKGITKVENSISQSGPIVWTRFSLRNN
jgi:hypothetical protein